jgi:protein phosphatase
VNVAESSGLTDPGRQRRRNEDAFVCEPPLFAVADGMGGAQAGELASRLAVSALRDYHAADHLDPEERLRAVVREANRRVFERAAADTLAQGMGTTVTAALVEGSRVTVGHVGDSRAYLLRHGALSQLTDDHSLVADLVRSGRLSPQEAETHPQRAVITRALGVDQDVDVDAFTVRAAPGDVLLLCSDGLTTMVSDAEIGRIVRESASLDAAARTLVDAANRRGGEDNVTVVLLRLEADESEAESEVEPAGGWDETEDTPSRLRAPDLAEPPPDVGPAPGPLLPPPAVPPAPPVPARVGDGRPAAAVEVERPRGIRWTRGLVVVLSLVVLALVAVGGALWGVSRANFVGVNDEGRVTVYQGVPWDLGGGVRLYRERYVSQVRAVQLSPDERAELLDHDLVSYEKARAEVRRYEQEAIP